MTFLLTVLLLGAQSCTGTSSASATTSFDCTTGDLAIFEKYTKLLEAQKTTPLTEGTVESVELAKAWLLNLESIMLSAALLSGEVSKISSQDIKDKFADLVQNATDNLVLMYTKDKFKAGDATYKAFLNGLFVSANEATNKALSVKLMPLIVAHWAVVKALDAYKENTNTTTRTTLDQALKAMEAAVENDDEDRYDIPVDLLELKDVLDTYLKVLADIQKEKAAAATAA